MNGCPAVYIFGSLQMPCVLEAGHRDGHFNDEHNFPVHWTAPVREAVRS